MSVATDMPAETNATDPAGDIDPVNDAVSGEPDANRFEDGEPETRRKRVLMLTHRLPYPPDRGDRIRSFHLLKLLSRHFDMAIACTTDEPAWLQHHQLLSTMAKRVELQPITSFGTKFRGMAALATGKAITPASFFRYGLADTIRLWHEQQPFDAVLTFCTGMLHYARLITGKKKRGEVKPENVRHVLDLVDVDSEKWASYAKSTWSPMRFIYGTEAKRLRKVEAGELDHFDAITVVSDREVDCYRDNVGDHPNVMAVGNGVDMGYFAPQTDPDNHNIVFVGVLDYKPNTDGVFWFSHEVMPLLRQRIPDATFTIVGRNPTQKIKQLQLKAGIEVAGSVPDVRAYLREASAVIAPLQIARGVQNKVLEAMSCQRTVVLSQGAADGIKATPDEHFLVADKAVDWANQLEKVLADKPLRTKIAKAARKRIEEAYTWEAQLKPMVELLGGDERVPADV